MAYNTIVPPPKIVDRHIIKPALCGPGPCDVWPSVAKAYSNPVISPLCDEYFHILGISNPADSSTQRLAWRKLNIKLSSPLVKRVALLDSERVVYYLRLWGRHVHPDHKVTLVSQEVKYEVLDDIRAGLQYLFQTKSKLVLAVSGAGHAGMETVITNLVGPGETLLIAARGMWDERAFIIAKRYGIKVEVTRVPIFSTFKLEHLEAEIKRIRPTALFITHGDSSTGSVQRIQGLGDICHKYGTLLIVDTVVSLAGVPFLTDEWGVDAVYTSTQKALSGPAGISPVAFSSRAQEKINQRKYEPPFYFDIKLLAAQWNCFGNTRSYHHTMSPPLLWALRASIKETVKETLEKSWDRHEATMLHFHKRLREFSFEFFVPVPEDRLATVTTVVLPKGYDYLGFVKYMRANHNILIFAGLGPTAGKTLRIGIMGINSTIAMADAIAEGMADTLRALKKSSL